MKIENLKLSMETSIKEIKPVHRRILCLKINQKLKITEHFRLSGLSWFQPEKQNQICFKLTVFQGDESVISDIARRIQSCNFFTKWVWISIYVSSKSIFATSEHQGSISYVANKFRDISTFKESTSSKKLSTDTLRINGKVKQVEFKKFEFDYRGMSTLKTFPGFFGSSQYHCMELSPRFF